jgi:hypothetical protein
MCIGVLSDIQKFPFLAHDNYILLKDNADEIWNSKTSTSGKLPHQIFTELVRMIMF